MVRVWGAVVLTHRLLLLVALQAWDAQAAPKRAQGADDGIGSAYRASRLDPGYEPRGYPREGPRETKKHRDKPILTLPGKVKVKLEIKAKQSQEKEQKRSVTLTAKTIETLVRCQAKEPCERQQTQPLQAQEETSEKEAAWTFAQQVLAELVDSVLNNLCESDCSYDPIERAIETDFLPWLMAEVEKTLEEKALGRAELGCNCRNLEI
ncbi:radial spoke head protein 3 [Grus japonensis]|uniref:Radial spoke head protein 3 n=1 Tax=Grus japonensis TaxID=30415 RepID=A0ABC9YAK9_GRUJA